MKKLTILFLGLFLFSSCTFLQKSNYSKNRAKSNALKSRDTITGNHIQLMNSKEVIKIDKPEIKQKFIGQATIASDDKKYPVKDVVAYQNDKAYYKKLFLGSTKKKDMYTNDFATRVKFGKLNIYKEIQVRTEVSTSQTGNVKTKKRNIVLEYVENPETGLSALTSDYDFVKPLVSNDPLSNRYLTKYPNQMKIVKRHRYAAWGAFGTSIVLSIISGTSKNNTVSSLTGVTSGALFLGSFVDGVFLNTLRRGKAANYVAKSVWVYDKKTKTFN